MRRFLGAALLAGAVLAAALPAESIQMPDAAGGEPLVAWLKSDGTSGVSPLSEFQAGTDVGTQSCGGIAPLENACTLEDTTRWPLPPFPNGWTIGFYLPSHPLTPGGAFVGSTIVNLTGSKSVVGCCWTILDQPSSLHFGCNWFFTTNIYGAIVVGDVNCGTVFQTNVNGVFWSPTGDLTAAFHAGALDPRIAGNFYGAVPGGNADEYGVGTWSGLLTVRG